MAFRSLHRSTIAAEYRQCYGANVTRLFALEAST